MLKVLSGTTLRSTVFTPTTGAPATGVMEIKAKVAPGAKLTQALKRP
jgi:hypothetical protein